MLFWGNGYRKLCENMRMYIWHEMVSTAKSITKIFYFDDWKYAKTASLSWIRSDLFVTWNIPKPFGKNNYLLLGNQNNYSQVINHQTVGTEDVVIYTDKEGFITIFRRNLPCFFCIHTYSICMIHFYEKMYIFHERKHVYLLFEL